MPVRILHIIPDHHIRNIIRNIQGYIPGQCPGGVIKPDTGLFNPLIGIDRLVGRSLYIGAVHLCRNGVLKRVASVFQSPFVFIGNRGGIHNTVNPFGFFRDSGQLYRLIQSRSRSFHDIGNVVFYGFSRFLEIL